MFYDLAMNVVSTAALERSQTSSVRPAALYRSQISQLDARLKLGFHEVCPEIVCNNVCYTTWQAAHLEPNRNPYGPMWALLSPPLFLLEPLSQDLEGFFFPKAHFEPTGLVFPEEERKILEGGWQGDGLTPPGFYGDGKKFGSPEGFKALKLQQWRTEEKIMAREGWG